MTDHRNQGRCPLRHGGSCQKCGCFGGVYTWILSYARTTVGIMRAIFARGIFYYGTIGYCAANLCSHNSYRMGSSASGGNPLSDSFTEMATSFQTAVTYLESFFKQTSVIGVFLSHYLYPILFPKYCICYVILGKLSGEYHTLGNAHR